MFEAASALQVYNTCVTLKIKTDKSKVLHIIKTVTFIIRDWVPFHLWEAEEQAATLPTK